MPTQMLAVGLLNSDQDSTLMWEAVTGDYNHCFEIGVDAAPTWTDFTREFISVTEVQISSHYQVSLLGGISPLKKLDRVWDGGVRGRSSVEKIVKNCPFLIGVLEEAYSEIRSRFGSEPVLLESNDSFEDLPEEGKLIITIRTKLNVHEARERLRDFDSYWWLPNIRKARGCLSIMLEYV